MKHGILQVGPFLAVIALVATLTLAAFQVRWISEAFRVERTRVQQLTRSQIDTAFGATIDEVRVLVSLADELTRYDHADRVDLNQAHERIAYWADRAQVPELLESVAIINPSGEGRRLAVWPTVDGSGTSANPDETVIEIIRAVDVPELNPFLNRSEMSNTVARLRERGVLVLFADAGYLLVVDINTERVLSDLLPRYLDTYLTDATFEIVDGFAGRGRDDATFDVPVWDAMVASFARMTTMPRVWTPGGRPPEDATDRERSDVAIRRKRVGPDIPLFLYLFDRSDPDLWSLPYGESEDPRLRVYLNTSLVAQRFSATRRMNLLDAVLSVIALTVSVSLLYRLYKRTDRLRAEEVRMLSAMSHELRTPLTVIESMSSNLRRGVVSSPERVAAYGASMNDQSIRLRQMIEGILTYVRSDFRNDKRNTGEGARHLDLAEIIDHTVRHLANVARERRINLEWTRPEQPVFVVGSESAARRVAENLITNAITYGATPAARFSPTKHPDQDDVHGRRRIDVDHAVDGQQHAVIAGQTHNTPYTGHVRVNLTSARRRALVTVEDDGPGLSEQDQGEVFAAFVRGSAAEHTVGTGLGLFLARQSMEAIDGSLTVESPYRVQDGTFHAGCRFSASFRLIPSSKDRHATDSHR